MKCERERACKEQGVRNLGAAWSKAALEDPPASASEESEASGIREADDLKEGRWRKGEGDVVRGRDVKVRRTRRRQEQRMEGLRLLPLWDRRNHRSLQFPRLIQATHRLIRKCGVRVAALVPQACSTSGRGWRRPFSREPHLCGVRHEAGTAAV